MTPAPEPTPYDITGIPFFPYTPGLSEWLLLSFLVLALIVLWLRLRPRKQSPEAALRVLLAELEPRECNSQGLSYLSLLVKRFILTRTGKDFAPYAARELRNVAAQESAPLQRLLLTLSEIDEAGYQPHDSAKEGAEKIARLRQIVRECFEANGGEK